MLECCPNPEPMMDHIHQLTDILFLEKCTTAGQFFILSLIFPHIVHFKSQVFHFLHKTFLPPLLIFDVFPLFSILTFSHRLN